MTSLLLVLVMAAAATRPGAEASWQVFTLLDDPRLRVSLVHKAVASPADTDFIGFEVENRTGVAIRLRGGLGFDLGSNEIRKRGTDEIIAFSGLPSGNLYDLEKTNGPPPINPSDRGQIIPPGTTRWTVSTSAHALSMLGLPTGPGYTVSAKARITVDFGFPSGEVLRSPEAGVPFSFDWLPLEARGLESARARLKSILRAPMESVGAYDLLNTFLREPSITAGVTPEEVVAAIRYEARAWGVNRMLLKYLDDRHPTSDALVRFMIGAIQSRNKEMGRDIAVVEHVHDARLVAPLLDWAANAPDGADLLSCLSHLDRHRDLIPDRLGTAAALTRIVLAKARFLAKPNMPESKEDWHSWSEEVRLLTLAGDSRSTATLVPYLDRKADADREAGGGTIVTRIPLRACDVAYDAILDLNGRKDERFRAADPANKMFPREMMWGPHHSHPQAKALEYARRDELIGRLKAELAR